MNKISIVRPDMDSYHGYYKEFSITLVWDIHGQFNFLIPETNISTGFYEIGIAE